MWPPLLVTTFLLFWFTVLYESGSMSINCKEIAKLHPEIGGFLDAQDCKAERFREVFLVNSTRTFNGRIVPIVAVLPRRMESKAAILDVIGGPASSIELTPNQKADWAIASGVAKKGIGYFRLAYSGTYERSHFPNANLPLAITEIEDIYISLKSTGMDVCLFGQSLGGFLTLYARQRARSKQFANSTAILFNPILLTGREALDFFDGHPDAKRLIYHRFNKVRFNNEGEEESVGLTDELRRDIFATYFGEELDVSPIGGDLTSVTVLYSKSEPQLGPENARLARKINPATYVELNTESHTIPVGWSSYLVRRSVKSALIDRCAPS